MPTVIVNDKPVEIADGEKLNCVQVAQRAGVEIPHYCWHPSLSVVASCRMCLVEIGEKKPDGTIAMQPKLFPGCQTPVKDGTVVVSNSEKVKQAQKATLEYLLLNHPLDCPVCDQAGECYLQDYSYRYGRGYTRLQEPKTLKPDKDYIGDQITLFTDRCVMCTRCVRFTREISGTAELQVINRGSHEEIDIFPGEPCNNKLAGNVVDICPVGALCSKDFLYKQRVWWLTTKPSVCPDCSTGCSIRVDQTNDEIKRFRPRPNSKAQGDFMCDDGRFGWKYIHSEKRLKQPEMRTPQGKSNVEWESILPALKTAFEQAVAKKPAGVAAVLSPWMTVEEAYLLARWIKKLSPQTRLALGPSRSTGLDDCYPKDVHGKALPNTKFTIRAEKCPNRKGVELILQHFQGSLIPFDTLLAEVDAGQVDTLFLANGDPHSELTESQVSRLGKLKLFALLDLLESPVSAKAHYLLAGGSFAERDGTFINHAGLAQAIVRAIRSPENARPDGRILWELTGRRGLFHATNLRREIGQEVPALAALSVGDLGEGGVLLTERPAATPQPVGAAH